MPANTTRLSLPYPLGSEAADLGAADFQALAAALDAIIAPTSSGPYGSRPTSTTGTPGIVDRRYYATDIGLTFRDTGTSWVPEGIPIGGYLPWAGDNDLTPELVRADGRLIDKTVYGGFFAMFGHRFNGGTDPGSNKVKIPDVLGRAVIGAGTGTGLTARTVGAQLGEETHTLSLAEMPGHSHQQVTRSGGSFDVPTVSATGDSSDGPLNAFSARSSARGAVSNTGAAGSGANHNNIQPSAVATILVRII